VIYAYAIVDVLSGSELRSEALIAERERERERERKEKKTLPKAKTEICDCQLFDKVTIIIGPVLLPIKLILFQSSREERTFRPR
jgi:hypothetical protein